MIQKNIDDINKHLAEKCESYMAKNEKQTKKPTTTDDIRVNLPSEAVQTMLWKYGKMWSGQLGEIKAPEVLTYLKQDSRLLKSHPYRAGPKARALKQSKINNQIND